MANGTGILVRPRQGRVLAGVCAAIANRFGWDVTIVRVVTGVAALFAGVALVLYIAFWIAIPADA